MEKKPDVKAPGVLVGLKIKIYQCRSKLWYSNVAPTSTLTRPVLGVDQIGQDPALIRPREEHCILLVRQECGAGVEGNKCVESCFARKPSNLQGVEPASRDVRGRERNNRGEVVTSHPGCPHRA
jgi:hypothetical protein